MKIDKENYIEILVDLLDGVLSPDQEEEVHEFLDRNPEIKEEFEGLSRMHLAPGQMQYADKEFLKKTPEEYFERKEVFDPYCLAYLDHDLDAGKQSEFEAYLEANPEKTKELDLYRKTRLQPDLKIRYPGKSSLKRYSLIRRYRSSLITVSAAAAMLVFAWLLVLRPGTYPPEQIAGNNTAEKILYRGALEEIRVTSNRPMQKIRAKSEASIYMTRITEKEPDQVYSENTLQQQNHPVTAMQKIEPLDISALSGNTGAFQLLAMTPGNPSYPARDMTLAGYPGKRINPIRILPEQVDREEDNALLKGLLIAGVEGFNTLTGEKVNIITGYNEQGNLVNLGFESPILAFSTPLRKKGP